MNNKKGTPEHAKWLAAFNEKRAANVAKQKQWKKDRKKARKEMDEKAKLRVPGTAYRKMVKRYERENFRKTSFVPEPGQVVYTFYNLAEHNHFSVTSLIWIEGEDPTQQNLLSKGWAFETKDQVKEYLESKGKVYVD